MYREQAYRYIPGDPLFICDECGLRYRRSLMRERWDHAIVCPKDYEERHQQEAVRGRADKISVKRARPRTTDKSNLLNQEPTTEGAGWTETEEALFTADNASSAVTWTGVVTETGTYRIGINIVSGGGSGSVVLTAGGDPITTSSINEEFSFVTDDITSIGDATLTATAFTGVVSVYLHKMISQDDL
jgi:hypothetical protein